MNHARVLLLRLTEQRLGLLTLRNIADYPGENVLFPVDVLPQGNLNRKFPSGAVQTRKFDCSPGKMLLIRLQVSPNGNPMRLMKVLGHKDGDLLVHHLRDGVAEDPFCSFVNKENGASFVDCQDGIRGRLGDDTEKLSGLREPFAGIAPSNSFRVPRFRHSRLITRRVAGDAHTRAN
jgi:hypothetical protein